ncbi:protein-glutamine gamma-glutamyltransferase 5-like [Labrus mixtus]|uniref:protein-glutamine gamma-glutamyltransferase 5-like n=1 Tax=Labrus mixtus TaxID=508554 RepID=UPI0029BFE8C1|nr:protein-glutamine gamma-glutamyltransferase 5-like [Labrus mixtus]
MTRRNPVESARYVTHNRKWPSGKPMMKILLTYVFFISDVSLFTGVELHCEANNEEHHTSEISVEKLIVRRVQSFTLTLKLTQAFQTDKDQLFITTTTAGDELAIYKHEDDPADDVSARCNPIYVGRVISAMINSEDDCGVLEGNWGRSFEGGHAPTHWTGSSAILTEWLENQFEPVKYGQCWVFAGVMCTVMRFFGIPCRVVTNFSSAHDNNANLTIDRYHSLDGIVGKETKDSIWNFHVWVEGWMRRPDMSKDGDYDGWQVLDPTPQELSQGVFCCGPSPKAAILNGDTDIKYDTPFVFAEVNADSVDWLVKPDGSLEKIEASTDLVGQHISTKAVGSDARVDITNTYKPEEGKIDERVVFRRAVFKHFKHLNKIREEEKKKRETETLEIHTLETEIREMERNGIPNRIGNVSTGETDGETTEVILPPPKVSIRFEEVSKPINGKDVSQKLVLSSESTADRPLIINIAVQAMNYTGHLAGNIQGEKLEKTLLPGKDLTMPIVVPFSVYSKPMLECDIMKISVLVKDKEKPDHPYLREVDLVLLDPPISVTIFGKVKLKTPANAEISFMNPVNETLKNCTLTISGTGLWKGEYEIKLGDLKPNRRIRLKFYIVPYKSGERTLTADFDCSLFRDIKGLCTVTVRP